MKQRLLFILLFILSLPATAQDEQEEETYYDILLPGQDEFVAQMYVSYKEGFEKFCDQQFMTEEAFREQMLNINYVNSKEEFTHKGSETYNKLINNFEQRVERKFKNLDVYRSDEKLPLETDDIRLTTKITSQVMDYNGHPFVGATVVNTGCKGQINWYLEIYKADQLIVKGEILFVVVRKKYEEPLQLLDHNVLVEGLKIVGVK